jgi:hypothetical protein
LIKRPPCAPTGKVRALLLGAGHAAVMIGALPRTKGTGLPHGCPGLTGHPPCSGAVVLMSPEGGMVVSDALQPFFRIWATAPLRGLR